jgi:hypothetical protein
VALGAVGEDLSPSPLNPLRLVGDFPALEPSMAQRQPGGNARDTRVEFRKIVRSRETQATGRAWPRIRVTRVNRGESPSRTDREIPMK